ncbi:hypothetical protein NP233_g8964 [Leucocoprinus birnbaumii]|uniref:F-box domain-containing protein n=1 Tax=Leucocoprinus birnbaumii TaxID=56174 RepID=A0AAD5VLM1_9AGAR|nr:hypothetical protein NP233_g8964 [Leucocoprinus birnbaumii]
MSTLHFPASVEPTETLARQNEINLLEAELRRIEDNSLRLKATVFTRLNAIRSPCGKIPAEILSFIFELVTAPTNSIPPCFVGGLFIPEHTFFADATLFQVQFLSLHSLSSVCSFWRQVAWSTTRLWSHLNLDLTVAMLNHHELALPRLYFDRSGDRPMSIAVDFRRVQPEAFPNIYRTSADKVQSGNLDFKQMLLPLRHLICIESARRVEYLQLNFPPPDWLPLLSKFTNLKRLELACLPYNQILPYQSMALSGLGALKKLTIDGVNVDIELPWSQITYLELCHISFEAVARLLTSCPNLIYFDAYALKRDPWQEPRHLPSEVTLPHLETFHWDWTFWNDNHTVLLPRLRFPALQRLYWREDDYEPEIGYLEHQEDIARFMEKLPSAQIHLRLNHFSVYDGEEAHLRLTTVLENMRYIKHLSIEEYDDACGHDTLSAVASLLHRSQREGKQMLPRLAQLSLLSSFPTSTYTKGLALLMQERRAAGITSFRLDVPSWLKPEYWNPIARTQLKNIVEGGFKLEVFEGEQMLSW